LEEKVLFVKLPDWQRGSEAIQSSANMTSGNKRREKFRMCSNLELLPGAFKRHEKGIESSRQYVGALLTSD
jgi:hypothetical protein